MPGAHACIRLLCAEHPRRRALPSRPRARPRSPDRPRLDLLLPFIDLRTERSRSHPALWDVWAGAHSYGHASFRGGPHSPQRSRAFSRPHAASPPLARDATPTFPGPRPGTSAIDSCRSRPLSPSCAHGGTLASAAPASAREVRERRAMRTYELPSAQQRWTTSLHDRVALAHVLRAHGLSPSDGGPHAARSTATTDSRSTSRATPRRSGWPSRTCSPPSRRRPCPVRAGRSSRRCHRSNR